MNDIEPKEISLTSHLRISKPGEYFWSGKPLATIRATAKQVGRGVTVKSHDFLDGERVKVIRKVTINNETLTACEIDKTAALRREVLERYPEGAESIAEDQNDRDPWITSECVVDLAESCREYLKTFDVYANDPATDTGGAG